MFGRKLIFLGNLLLITLLNSCTPPPPAQTGPDQELLYQAYTLSGLSAGDFEGEVSIGELRYRGDFGLGTFDALDGEMVVLDGVVYQVHDDGMATVADDSTETPFAVVTYFVSDQSLVISETSDCPAIQAQIDSQLPALDAPYAVKVSGEFTSLKVRAPHKQSEPYPTLTEALADQVLFESQNISGTMVGFRLPEYMAGANSAGYHFHFISDDKQHGGHVLECQADRLTVQIDTIDRIQIDVASTNGQPQQAPITYGLLLPFSGQYEWLGRGAIDAVLMIDNDVNSNGGINGAPIQFVQGDTQGDDETGAAAAQTMIEQGVVALIGPTSLSFSGIMPLITENEIPMISPSAGTVALDRAGSDYFYRTVPSDSLGGRAIAHAIVNGDEVLGQQFENVVLMVMQDAAFLSFQEPIESGFASAGKQLAATIALTPGALSYAEAAQEALGHSPDLIILVANPEDLVAVMGETITAGYTGRWFFTQEQIASDYMTRMAAELIADNYALLEIAAPESAPQLAAFNQRYTNQTTQPQQAFTTNTYDAATVLALAMLRASIHNWDVTNETINANIPLVANPGEGKVTVTSYLEGKDVLMAGGEINYQGITGSIDFDEYGNVTQPYGIFQGQGGEWVQISTIDDNTLQTMLEAQ